MLCLVRTLTLNRSNLISGQTGSGKTHTMLNPKDGLFFMAARGIFERTGSLVIGAYEIYRGTLFDILNERRKVVACEQADGTVKILGLRETQVTTFQELYDLVCFGLNNRSVGTPKEHSHS